MRDLIKDNLLKYGFFIYRPKLWSNEADCIIKELDLPTLADIYPSHAGVNNNAYIYVEKGNPRNIEP